MVITKNYKSVKNSTRFSITKWQLYKAETAHAEQGGVIEPNVGEITRDRTTPLFNSKICSIYAYRQMKFSKETNRQCVFAFTEAKFSGYYQFKKGFYGMADISIIFQAKIDRTLKYCTPASLDDIIVVTRGDKQEHEKISLMTQTSWKKLAKKYGIPHETNKMAGTRNR